MARPWVGALRRWSARLADLAPSVAPRTTSAATASASFTTLPSGEDTPRPPTHAVALQYTDFSAVVTAAGITSDTAVTAIGSADRGQPAQLCDLVDSMLERDGHMAGACRLRRLSIVGAPHEVLEPRGNDPRNTEITEACKQQLEDLADLHDYKLHLTSSLHHPVACLANRWDVSEGQARLVQLLPFPAKRFAWNTQYTDGSMGELGEMRLLTLDNPTFGERLWDGGWTINSDRALAAWPFRAGLGRLLLWQYLFKIYGVKDWATYAELCGLPFIYAKIDRKAPDADRRALRNALAMLGTEATGIFSPETDLQQINRAVHDGQIYSKFIHFQNDEVSKAVLGHVASADAVSGSLGGAETTAVTVRQDLLEADARALEKAIQSTLRWFVFYNWGPTAPVPRFHVLVDLPDNLKVRSEVDEKLIGFGVKLGERYIYEAYGRPVPAEGEATVGGGGDSDLGTVGAQVTAVLQLVDAVNAGTLDREHAINIYLSIFGGNREKAAAVIPERNPNAPQSTGGKSGASEAAA